MKATPTATAPLIALSIDAALAERLGRGRVRGRVHSVFDHVVNVRLDGRLVSLCTAGLDDAPASVRVAVPSWRRVRAGDDVTADAASITLGGLRVDLSPACAWRAPRPHPVSTAALRRANTVLATVLADAGVHGGALEAGEDPFAAAVAARIRRGVAALGTAEHAADAEAMAVALRGLIGLGPGLTPAGDDVLTGIALVAAIPDARITVLPAVLDSLIPSAATTAVSRATLDAAVHGRARARLAAVISALDADPTVLADAARAALEIGHTSGTDLLTGIRAGIRLETELRGAV